jgi:hypothetical protein
MSKDVSAQLPPGRSTKPDNVPDILDEAVLAGGPASARGLEVFIVMELMELLELPPNTRILSINPSGSSAWVQTVHIDAHHADGLIKAYFMKVY